MVLDTAADAIRCGSEWLKWRIADCEAKTGKVKVRHWTRDGRSNTVTKSAKAFLKEWKGMQATYEGWLGKPDDNAAAMGALVILLQSRGPVEIWIQQGWMGGAPEDGVTLFKLDFNGAFDPSALAFWLGHPDKDTNFAFIISRGLGRHNMKISTTAEIPCDLYMCGDWMQRAGIHGEKFASILVGAQHALMAKWIAETAVKLLQ